MKKLIIVALLGLAVWQGWKHYPELRSRAPSHEAVIQNSSGQTLTRVRLTVGGQTFVKEEIAPDQTATFPFRVNQDSQFSMTWEWKDRSGESHWSGGDVFKGPMVARHVITVSDDGGVIYQSENRGASAP
jgi:hypothetical protein